MKQLKNFYIYTTERIGVRGLCPEDVTGNYRNWLNDPEVCKYNSHGVFPMGIVELQGFVQSLSGDRSKIIWAIDDLKSGRHIGNVTLQAINMIYRSAEFAIVLGEKDFWGKGYSYEASYLIVKHGFERLNLNRIHCGTAEGNEGMKKLAKKLKMSQEGIRRQALFLNGEYVDAIEYGVLRDEFLRK